MAAPDFAELEWSPADTGGWTTEGTSAWWDVYNRDRAGFKALGFSVSKPAAKWLVTAPDIDDANRADFHALLLAIAEGLIDARERFNRQVAAQEARDDAWRAKRAKDARAAQELAQAQILEARSIRHSLTVADARAAGHACSDKWGTLVHLKDTLAQLVSLPLLTHAQIRLVYALITETERKAHELARRAAGVRDEDCVTWSDDAVDRGVRHMTALDGDHAKHPNDVGWGPQHSPSGHWCVAMLDTDRGAALRLARTLVGHYRGQLSTILSHQEMP